MKSKRLSIQLKGIQQYFPVALFIVLCKVTLTLWSFRMKCCFNSLLYLVVATFESVDEIQCRV